MRMKKWVNRYRIVLFVGLVIVAAVGTYGFNEYNRKLPGTQQLKTAFKIEAVAFVSEFEADASAATKKICRQSGRSSWICKLYAGH